MWPFRRFSDEQKQCIEAWAVRMNALVDAYNEAGSKFLEAIHEPHAKLKAVLGRNPAASDAQWHGEASEIEHLRSSISAWVEEVHGFRDEYESNEPLDYFPRKLKKKYETFGWQNLGSRSFLDSTAESGLKALDPSALLRRDSYDRVNVVESTLRFISPRTHWAWKLPRF